MKSFRSIQRQLLALAPKPRSETISAASACGRVLLQDVVARVNDPAESRSAMDGYAVRAADLHEAAKASPAYLRESGTLPAGRASLKPLKSGEARRIMTGAPLPPGADAVVPLERVHTDGHRVQFTAPTRPGGHVRMAGENFLRGDRLVAAHTVLRPQEVALCITAGVPRVSVSRPLSVGVLSTGSELVPPSRSLRRGEVFDSNRPMLLAQVAATGARPVDLGSIGDRVSLLQSRLKQARERTQVLITVGGVSAGDFDIVKLLLRSYRQVQQVQVAMRPARPQAFGRIGRLFWYALPGNPVSAMVAFDTLVRPFLLRAMGHTLPFRPLRRATCEGEIRSVLGLRDFVRVRAYERNGQWRVCPVGPEGSSNLRSMVEANALAMVREDCKCVAEGQEVEFELLSDPPLQKDRA